MCNNVLSGTCHVEIGVKFLSTKIDPSGLYKHVASHKETVSDITRVAVTIQTKQRVADAVGQASVCGCLPLTFLYTHPRMLSLATALFNYGQGLSASAAVEIRTLFPPPFTVCAATARMANERCRIAKACIYFFHGG